MAMSNYLGETITGRSERQSAPGNFHKTPFPVPRTAHTQTAPWADPLPNTVIYPGGLRSMPVGGGLEPTFRPSITCCIPALNDRTIH